MDEVKIFVDTIDGTTAVNHIGNHAALKDVGSGNKILVNDPEIIAFDTNLKTYINRYLLEFNFDTEANLTTAINALVTNIQKFQRREAIAGYTKPNTLYHIYLANAGKITPISKRWECILYLECEWGM